MRIRLLGAIGAVLLALIGAVLISAYVRGADARARAGLETEDVLIVSKAVPVGTPIEDLGEMVRTEAVPLTVLAPDAVNDLSEHSGRVTGVDLLPGEQLLAGRLVDPRDLVSPGTIPVPDGLQEISLLIPPDRVVGGRVQAGDTLGMFLSFDGGFFSEAQPPMTHLAIQKLLVTSVQGAVASTGETDEADASAEASATPAVPEGSVYVTLAVSAADAERIVFTQEFGRIWLSKGSAETSEDGTRIVDEQAEVFP